MCGISGIIAKRVDRYTDAGKRMVDSMYHRGPDGNGTYLFENSLLAHNRLSIVDLASGDQPMLNTDRSVGIVFNGEIYGYQQIRSSLNYDYKNTSDTEVILALYEKYGVDLLPHLPGMFAFGLWDEKERRFFAARDRFGEKPFFYALTKDNELVFASEIKAILASGLIQPETDLKSVSRYLSHGYTGPLNTIYKNILCLPPGHMLTYKDGSVQVKKYWYYPDTVNNPISLSEATDKFEALFTNAVRKQMIADVEVCAFLSGGLDSTSVVSVAHKVNPSLKTLAFGYKNELSELPYAKAAANMYQTDHHELHEGNEKLEDIVMMLPDIYDEPFSDSSAIATYQICKAASKFGKVVLTGDAGDELLGGYTWWYRPLLNDIAAKNSSSAKAAFVLAMASVEKAKEKLSGGLAARTWRDQYVGIKRGRQYNSIVSAAAGRFAGNGIAEALGLPQEEKFTSTWNEDGTINDAMKFDIADYMPGDILVKTDRAAMANSLELRSPFLDVELAEFCISMPGEYKIDSKYDKILLREAMSKYWPKEIKERGKQGFGISGGHWSQSPGLKQLYNDYLHDKNSALYNIVPFEETQSVLKQTPTLTFSMLILAIWSSKQHN